MATEAKRLYRSDDRAIAGVCAGIAEYCDIDPVIARILAVLLTISSLGIVALVYVVLWLVLPCRVGADAPIACDAYLRAQPHEGAQAPRCAPAIRPGSRPIPPVGHPAWNAEYAAFAQGQAAPAARPARYEAVSRAGGAAPCEARAGMGGITRLCVWAGVTLLAIGISVLLGTIVTGVEWWQLWPCMVILAGVVKMVVPARRTLRMRRFSHGLAIFSTGVLLLALTVGLLDWRTVARTLGTLWPMLLIAAGLGLIARAVHDELFSLAGSLCLVAVCVCAMTAFAVPGDVQYVMVRLPFLDGSAYVFDINPWR